MNALKELVLTTSSFEPATEKDVSCARKGRKSRFFFQLNTFR